MYVVIQIVEIIVSVCVHVYVAMGGGGGGGAVCIASMNAWLAAFTKETTQNPSSPIIQLLLCYNYTH